MLIYANLKEQDEADAIFFPVQKAYPRGLQL